jgi:hypothetical protein
MVSEMDLDLVRLAEGVWLIRRDSSRDESQSASIFWWAKLLDLRVDDRDRLPAYVHDLSHALFYPERDMKAANRVLRACGLILSNGRRGGYLTAEEAALVRSQGHRALADELASRLFMSMTEIARLPVPSGNVIVHDLQAATRS